MKVAQKAPLIKLSVVGFFMCNKALLALCGILLSFQVYASGSVVINGKLIKDRDHLHAIFAKQLNFPSNYGKTLDSLYENLSTDYSGESIIKIRPINLLKVKLGSEYINSMIQMIMNAAENNSHIILVIE